MSADQRVAVVTGASAGVGRAVAREFARRRYRVALLARGHEALEATRAEVEDLGSPRAVALPTDVADAGRVEAAAAAAEEALGPIDVWVNNAMASVFGFVDEIDPADFRRVTEVVYLGYVHGSLSAVRRMLPRDRGTIVQVGSALAYRSIPLQAAYCGAKSAIRGFNDSLRCELMHRGSAVRTTMVQLPAQNTPQFEWVKALTPRHPRPVAPVYQPEVGARGIVWAAEHPPRELNVGISTVATRVANVLAPGLLDRYLAATNVEAQQTGAPIDPDRPDYLWHPIEGDRGAHGRFDDEASSASPQLWAATHRRTVTGVGAALASAALWSFARTRRDT